MHENQYVKTKCNFWLQVAWLRNECECILIKSLYSIYIIMYYYSYNNMYIRTRIKTYTFIVIEIATMQLATFGCKTLLTLAVIGFKWLQPFLNWLRWLHKKTANLAVL